MNDEQKPPQTEVVGLSAEKRTFWRSWSKKQRWLVGGSLGLLIVLSAIGLALLVLYVTEDPETINEPEAIVSQQVCDAEIIRQASSAISENNLLGLGVIIENITDRDGYQNDIDCGYIVTRYYIATGQVELARTSLGKVEQQRAVGQLFSLEFDPPALSVESLRGLVEVAETSANDDEEISPIQLSPDGEAP
jgi:hypothetical protein